VIDRGNQLDPDSNDRDSGRANRRDDLIIPFLELL
jgi:hypothetical protein